jgi:FkbM family methyltransferase
MKKTIIRILRALTAPIRNNEKFFILFKDVVTSNDSEHLSRAVRIIRKSGCSTQGKQILDLGANDGSTTLFFASHFPECQVTGFEPLQGMFTKAQDTLRNYPNASMIKVACADHEGEADFYVSANFVSSSLLQASPEKIEKEDADYQMGVAETSVEKVKTTRLDAASKDMKEILLIKIDTQGTELMILQNGTETLKKTQFVLTELNNHTNYESNCQYYEVDAILRSQGFKLADLVVTYRDSQHAVKEFDVLYERA